MQRDDFIKAFINALTGSRIVLSIALLFLMPFSPAFFAVYAACGISDILDGFLARHFHKESCFGAKLDSIADAVFAVALAVIVIMNIAVPLWVWGFIILIFAVRVAGYAVGFIKYRTFSSLHTYLNKLCGAMLFLFPVLYVLFGLNISAIVVIIIALISSIEELVITIKSKTLDRDCKGIFIK